MLTSLLSYIFSELPLIAGITHLCLMYLCSFESARSYAKVSRFWILVSVLGNIVFYNNNIDFAYFQNDSYTLMFKVIISFFAYIMLGTATMWFQTKNGTGCRYGVLILFSLIGMKLMISSVNLMALFLSYCLLVYINGCLLSIGSGRKMSEAAFKYVVVSAGIVFIFAAGVYFLYALQNGNMDYESLKEVFAGQKKSFSLFLAVVSTAVPFLYSLGIAPFHIMSEENSGRSELPISHFFAIVLPLALWGTFIKINVMMFEPYKGALSMAYVCFALLSILFGAIGANARINLHRIMAYSSMYHFGFTLLLLSFFQRTTDFTAFVYLLMYMLGLNGIYMVFYGLKSHSEYLTSVTSLSGLAETRPYITGALLISMFSMLGIPPLAGFISQFGAFTSLLEQGSYICLGIIICSLLILAKAYLEIVKTAYFDYKTIIFDTENRSVILYIALSIVCISGVAFNPYNFFYVLKDMFYGISL